MIMSRIIGEFIVMQSVPQDILVLKGDTIQAGVGDLQKYANNLSAVASANTFWLDNRVVGLGGHVIYYPGVAEAWSVWSKKVAYSNKLSMVKCARVLNDEFARENGIWRMQAMRTKNVPSSWFEHIGFDYECTLMYFGMDCGNVDVYRKIYPENLI